MATMGSGRALNGWTSYGSSILAALLPPIQGRCRPRAAELPLEFGKVGMGRSLPGEKAGRELGSAPALETRRGDNVPLAQPALPETASSGRPGRRSRRDGRA